MNFEPIGFKVTERAVASAMALFFQKYKFYLFDML